MRNFSLDIIRVLALFSVVFTHWSIWTGIPNILTQVHGGISFIFWNVFWKGSVDHPGVVMFIVLSGFLIHLPQSLRRDAKDPTKKKFWGTFLMRRFVRLMPVYWFASFCGIAVLMLMTAYPEYAPDFAKSDNPIDGWSIRDVIFHFCQLDVFIFSKKHLLGNGPVSTVEVLFWIYMAYPAIYTLKEKFGWGFILIGALILQFASVLIHVIIGTRTMGTDILHFLFFWCIGASSIDYYLRWMPTSRNLVLTIVTLFSLYIVLVYTNPFTGKLSVVVRYATTNLLGIFMSGSVIFLFSRSEKTNNSNPIKSFFNSCSKISYSMFAIHTPIIIAVLMLDNYLALTGMFWYQLLPLLVILVFTWFTYTVIERPAHSLARKLFPLYSHTR